MSPKSSSAAFDILKKKRRDDALEYLVVCDLACVSIVCLLPLTLRKPGSRSRAS
jgi:hypothetical protein